MISILGTQKGTWRSANEWPEKWYNTQFSFLLSNNKENKLLRLFTKADVDLIALNNEWFVEIEKEAIQRDNFTKALKHPVTFLTNLTLEMHSYLSIVNKTIQRVESTENITPALLSEIKDALTLLWCIFNCDFGADLDHFIENRLSRSELNKNDIDQIRDYYFVSHQKLAYQVEKKEFAGIASSYKKTHGDSVFKFRDLPEAILTQLTRHTEKFSWLTTNQIDTEPDKVLDYYDKLKKLLLGTPKSRRKPSLNPKIVKKLSKKDIRILDLINKTISIDNVSADFSAKLDFLMRKKLSEKFKISFSDLTWYLFDELEDLVETNNRLSSKELGKRKKFRAMIKINGELECFYGKSRFIKLTKAIKQNSISNSSKNITGIIACRGLAKGTVKIVKGVNDINKINEGDILVTVNTKPEFLMAILKCRGVVTDWGGITSHAAIITREFGIPCIVGTGIATQVFKDGDIVEIDANEGVIKILE